MSFRQCVNITIIGDVFFENNETILFMLTDNEGNEDILDDTAAMVYVNIVDNDGMCLGVSLEGHTLKEALPLWHIKDTCSLLFIN